MVSSAGTRDPNARRPNAVVAVIGLGVLIVFAAGLGSAIRLTGPRWLPDWARSYQGPTRSPQPLERPTRPPSMASTAPRDSVANVDLSWLFLAVTSVALLVVAVLVWRWLLRQRTPDAPDAAQQPLGSVEDSEVVPLPEPEVQLPILRRGLEAARDILDTERIPRDAVVAAWLGLQEAAEDSGVPRRAAETPTEFTTRILAEVHADERAIATLLELYVTTRFSDHLVTADDVARVRTALDAISAGWASR